MSPENFATRPSTATYPRPPPKTQIVDCPLSTFPENVDMNTIGSLVKATQHTNACLCTCAMGDDTRQLSRRLCLRLTVAAVTVSVMKFGNNSGHRTALDRQGNSTQGWPSLLSLPSRPTLFTGQPSYEYTCLLGIGSTWRACTSRDNLELHLSGIYFLVSDRKHLSV